MMGLRWLHPKHHKRLKILDIYPDDVARRIVKLAKRKNQYWAQGCFISFAAFCVGGAFSTIMICGFLDAIGTFLGQFLPDVVFIFLVVFLLFAPIYLFGAYFETITLSRLIREHLMRSTCPVCDYSFKALPETVLDSQRGWQCPECGAFKYKYNRECQACGYQLHGLMIDENKPLTCPECGHVEGNQYSTREIGP